MLKRLKEDQERRKRKYKDELWMELESGLWSVCINSTLISVIILECRYRKIKISLCIEVYAACANCATLMIYTYWFIHLLVSLFHWFSFNA